MSVSSNLRKIAAELRKAVAEEQVDREAIVLACRRIDMQAEMIEEGLDEPDLVSVE